MNRMEGNVIDSVDVLNVVIRIDAMTFECEIILWIDWIDLREINKRV